VGFDAFDWPEHISFERHSPWGDGRLPEGGRTRLHFAHNVSLAMSGGATLADRPGPDRQCSSAATGPPLSC